MTQGPKEIEAKFRVTDPAAGREMLTAPTVAGLIAIEDASNTMRFEDRYIDTDDAYLQGIGWTLRLRRIRGGTLGSLKRIRAGRAGGMFVRDEIESKATDEPNPTAWPDSPVALRSRKLVGERPIAIRATVRQDRRKRVFEGPNDTRIELSLDRVWAVAPDGAVVEDWLELELELEHGDERVLFEAAKHIARHPHLVPEKRSKGERALAAVAARPKARARR
jgi:inorganic triphosphatase YgiF